MFYTGLVLRHDCTSSINVAYTNMRTVSYLGARDGKGLGDIHVRFQEATESVSGRGDSYLTASTKGNGNGSAIWHVHNTCALFPGFKTNQHRTEVRHSALLLHSLCERNMRLHCLLCRLLALTRINVSPACFHHCSVLAACPGGRLCEEESPPLCPSASDTVRG